MFSGMTREQCSDALGGCEIHGAVFAAVGGLNSEAKNYVLASNELTSQLSNGFPAAEVEGVSAQAALPKLKGAQGIQLS